MRQELRNIAYATVRRILPPPGNLGAVRTEPLSRDFGLERGKPIDRRYIEAFLARHVERIHGVALEVAEPAYSSVYRDRLERIEIMHVASGMPHATLIGDLTRTETLPSGLADIFICTQVLPVIFDLAAAIRGIHHVLKPGGTVLATVPGISQISQYDHCRWGDYWRFTDKSARLAMEQVFGAGNVMVETFGNLYAAKAMLDGLAVEDLPDPTILDGVDPDYPVTIGIRATKSV